MVVLGHGEEGFPFEASGGFGLESALVVVVALAALLYAVGFSRRASRSRSGRGDALFFTAGLGTLAVALAPPLATYDDELFWVHMTQHVLLLVVAPPLLLLGRPWATMSRALPLRVRRPVAQAVVRLWARGWARAVRSALGSPAVAATLFLGTLAVWHLPSLWDATLRSTAVHVAEHGLFLATGLLFWSHLVDSPPLRSAIGYPARALYATIATVASSLLAGALALAPAPLYSGYAELSSRPGGLSAEADQQLAAGIMWVPGSIPFAAAIMIYAYRWLAATSAPQGAPNEVVAR